MHLQCCSHQVPLQNRILVEMLKSDGPSGYVIIIISYAHRLEQDLVIV